MLTSFPQFAELPSEIRQHIISYVLPMGIREAMVVSKMFSRDSMQIATWSPLIKTEYLCELDGTTRTGFELAKIFWTQLEKIKEEYLHLHPLGTYVKELIKLNNPITSNAEKYNVLNEKLWSQSEYGEAIFLYRPFFVLFLEKISSVHLFVNMGVKYEKVAHRVIQNEDLLNRFREKPISYCEFLNLCIYKSVTRRIIQTPDLLKPFLQDVPRGLLECFKEIASGHGLLDELMPHVEHSNLENATTSMATVSIR